MWTTHIKRAQERLCITILVPLLLNSIVLVLYSYLLITKYVYIKSTTVYVPSSELGLSQPLSRQRVFPSPQERGGGTTLSCGWGVGGVPILTTGVKA